MGEKRWHQRVNCAEKCFLYCANTAYSGAILNISISGVLIKLNGYTPVKIGPGDSCNLILSNDPSNAFFRYKVRIARVNPEGMGLQILEHEF